MIGAWTLAEGRARSRCDNFWPPKYQRPDPMTNVAENLLFIRAAGHTGGVALTGYNILYRLLEGSQGDPDLLVRRRRRDE
jgi:hypothetical protein